MRPSFEQQNIRWKILAILHAARKSGKAQIGGWLDLAILRKLLDSEGHALAENELRDYCVYLGDKEIGCLESKRDGDSAPYRYRYRITAKGVRAVGYEENVPGVGIYSEKGESE